jgi:hypothetical protein
VTDEFADLDLRKALKEVHRGELIKPALRTFLFDAEYPEDFAVHFRKEQTRAPDGWFWPSTHPLWSPLMLYTYLTAPHRLPTEHREYGNTMSLVMGTAIHAFVEMCLTVMGLRPAAMNVCTSCPPEKGCKEPGFADEDTGSRGHMDGLLDLSEILPKVARFLERTDGLDYPGFEFKTLSNQMRAAKIEQGGLDFYRQTWPEYYAQNQEYMRLSGRRAMLVLFLTMGYPWEMVELVVPYDPVAANQVRDKYLAVREAVAKNQAPTCCQRKGCKMYKICQSTGETERAISARYLIGSDGRRGFTH